MTLLEAIEARHSVRRYKDEPIPEEILANLCDRIREINEETGLHIQLVTGEPKAFSSPMAYGSFSGVKNYLVMAGKKGEDLDEKIGCYIALGYGETQGKVPKVLAKPLFSMVGYSKMDLGIVKYHFEVGAGKESFEWE